MTKLYVIGNGFDIGHEIRCKYSHFQEYLNDKRADILEVMNKFYYIGKDSKLWSDFETCLESDINYQSLSEIVGENSPNFASDDFSDSEWYDAQIYIEQECDELLERIRSGFKEWVTSLEILQVNKKYDLSHSDMYITFNYTEVLEKIYNIPLINILHIHNKVGEELIFGHGKSLEHFNVKNALYDDENAFLSYDEDGNVESKEVGHERFAEAAVCAFYDKMRKPTEKILNTHVNFFKGLLNIQEVVVLGHSYNEIDLPYFIKIVESTNNNTKWTLFYFSDKDKLAAEKIMTSLRIKKQLCDYKQINLLKTEDEQPELF